MQIIATINFLSYSWSRSTCTNLTQIWQNKTSEISLQLQLSGSLSATEHLPAHLFPQKQASLLLAPLFIVFCFFFEKSALIQIKKNWLKTWSDIDWTAPPSGQSAGCCTWTFETHFFGVMLLKTVHWSEKKKKKLWMLWSTKGESDDISWTRCKTLRSLAGKSILI